MLWKHQVIGKGKLHHWKWHSHSRTLWAGIGSLHLEIVPTVIRQSKCIHTLFTFKDPTPCPAFSQPLPVQIGRGGADKVEGDGAWEGSADEIPESFLGISSTCGDLLWACDMEQGWLFQGITQSLSTAYLIGQHWKSNSKYPIEGSEKHWDVFPLSLISLLELFQQPQPPNKSP